MAGGGGESASGVNDKIGCSVGFDASERNQDPTDLAVRFEL